MFIEKLNRLIKTKDSLVCVGLDTDIERIPPILLNERDPLWKFNREIVQATAEFAVAFKLNIAFYESLGVPGWQLLEKTLNIIPPDVLIIADAKRADIGNTARKYAETYFQTYSFDAITVSPYMGSDSVIPFLEFQEKGVFILCLTSNPGSRDFQYLSTDSEPLYMAVARQVNQWHLDYGNCGLVVGATHPEDMSSLREISPRLPFLIPGIGAQGGNLYTAVQFGTDKKGQNALIASSRSIIYASQTSNFAEAAAQAAQQLREDINRIRRFKSGYLLK